MKTDKSFLGCLSHLRTEDSAARRRFKWDEDGFYSGSLFRLDADLKLPQAKCSRRLPFKTQVVTCPMNGLIRNRMSHTMEVMGIATTIAKDLGLNVDLTRAIALGHDIGHVPFGHVGEKFLSEKLGREFKHEVFGVVIAQKIERKGKGLNLTRQTLEGILHHSRGKKALKVVRGMSQEASAVMFADKIAFILADYNDLMRLNPTGFQSELVTKVMFRLGKNQRARTRKITNALCLESKEKGKVDFGDCRIAKIFSEAKELMYGIYHEINFHGAERAMERVFQFIDDIFKNDTINPFIFFALMTDNDVLSLARENILDITKLHFTSVWEQCDYLRKLKRINITDPDLNW